MASTDKLSEAIGRKIMMLRKRKGLTLSELAKLAGVSKSTLSEIESGNVNPTISTLWAIARALGVSFGELVEPLQEVCTEDVCVQLLKRGFNTELYLMYIRRGVTYLSHPHPEGTRESIIVLRGKLLCGPIDRPTLLQAGSSITFSADKSHIYATFEEDVALLVLIRYRSLFAIPNEVVELDNTNDSAIMERLKSAAIQVQNGLPSYHIVFMGSEEQFKGKIRKYMKDLQIPKIKAIYVERESKLFSIYLFHRDPLGDSSWLKLDLSDSSELLKHYVKLFKKLSHSKIDKKNLAKYIENIDNIILNLILIEYLSLLGEVVELSYLESLYKFLSKEVLSIKQDISLLYTIFEPLTPGFVREIILLAYYIEKLLRNRGKLKVLYIDSRFSQLPLYVLKTLSYEDARKLDLTCIFQSNLSENLLNRLSDTYTIDIVCGDPSQCELCCKFDLVLLRISELSNLWRVLDKCYNVLHDNGLLIVFGDFIPYFTDYLSRIKMMIIHYLTYVIDSIIELLEENLSEIERRFIILVKACCCDAYHELLSGMFERGLSYFFKYYKDVEDTVHRIDLSNIRNMLLISYLSNYLKLRELRLRLACPDKVTTIHGFTRLVERSGFEVVDERRVYSTYNDGGSYVIVFKRV